MSAPLPEYTISGSYSSDRLRGARPKGSPRRLAVADRDVSSHQTPTKRHVHNSGHFCVRVSKATFRLCTTKLITKGIGTIAGLTGIQDQDQSKVQAQDQEQGPIQSPRPRTKSKDQVQEQGEWSRNYRREER